MVIIKKYYYSPEKSGFIGLDSGGTEYFLTDEDRLQGSTNKWHKVEKARCTECGEEAHASVFGLHGCENSTNKFWGKVRKLYWHRFAKTLTP